jgi:hypothetical protein
MIMASSVAGTLHRVDIGLQPLQAAAAAITNALTSARLAAALQGHRHLKSKRVLCLDDDSPLTQDVVGEYVRKAGRKATFRRAALIDCVRRSAPTWQCAVRRHVRSRSWPDIRI